MGTCRYCVQNAGFLRKQHSPCRDLHTTGIQEMTQLAAQAASAHTFNEAALRQSLSAIAQRSRATGEDIDRALEEGFRQGVAHAMSDGILTRDEEERLRAFRDRLALETSAADQGALDELDRAGADRVVMEARLAAISVRDGDGYFQDLALSIRQADMGQGEANRLLIRAWETAVQGSPGGRTSLPGRGERPGQVRRLLLPDTAGPGTERRPDQPRPGRGAPGRHPGHHPKAATRERGRLSTAEKCWATGAE